VVSKWRSPVAISDREGFRLPSGAPIRMDAPRFVLKSYPYEDEVKARRKKRSGGFLSGEGRVRRRSMVKACPSPLSLPRRCMAQVPPLDPATPDIS